MVLKNHIAHRFLTDDGFLNEGLETFYGKDWYDLPTEKIASMYELLSKDDVGKLGHKVYYITDTVIDKLDLLHVKKTDDKYNWSVFNHLPNTKKTFIFSDNSLLRLVIRDENLYFCHLSFKFQPNSKLYGEAYWVLFFVNRYTNEECEHFEHPDVKTRETFIYKLLCFIFLSENTEEVVQPGRKTGTRANGKFINSLNIPVTIVNSKWNVTSIRTTGFPVSGHFRLQGTGEGRAIPKMVWVNPYEKSGYVRKAANEQ